MKKIIAVLLALVLLIPSASVSADDWEYEITVTYNGEPVLFDVEPQIINDRTMVPFRAIFETLGGTVDFDAETRTVSSEMDGKTLSFVIGEYEAVLKTDSGEEKIAIDTAPVIVDDYTLVPVRFVAESSGLKVNWDDFYREVVIIDTDAWRETIAEKSEFLDMLINMPLQSALTDTPLEANEEAEIKLSFAMNNMSELYTTPDEGPDNINLSVSLKILSDEYYDGENSLSESAVSLDLSSIGKFLKAFENEFDDFSQEDKEMFDKIFKLHNINLEIIVDKNNNIYLKSEEIVELMKELGAEKEALMLGDNYIKLPFPEEAAAVMEAQTLWDYVEKMVQADDYIYTQDVKMIEYIIGAVADVYSDESVKIDKKSDGTHEITIDVTKDDYVAAMKSVIDAMWEYEENYMGQSERAFIEEQKQIMYDSLEIFDFYAKGSISIKDEFTQSGDISTAFEIKDMLIPGTEDVRLSFGLEMTVKSSSKQASKTEKIEIPENVFEITQ